jgi:hypothetical protein
MLFFVLCLSLRTTRSYILILATVSVIFLEFSTKLRSSLCYQHDALFGQADRIQTCSSQCSGSDSHEQGIRGHFIVLAHALTNFLQLLTSFEEAITPNTKLAVFDHISSSPGNILPIKDMIAICKAKYVNNIISFSCFELT